MRDDRDSARDYFEGLAPEYLKVDCVDANGREVRIAGESAVR